MLLLIVLSQGRMAHRKNHYMPAGLLDSQFATLEVPQGEERERVVEVSIFALCLAHLWFLLTRQGIDGSLEDTVASSIRKLDEKMS